MNNYTRYAIGLAAAALVVSIPLVAGPHGRGGFGGHEGGLMSGLHRLHSMKGELGITAEQEQQLKVVHQSVRDENRELSKQMPAAFMNAGAVLLANPDDLAGARAVLQRQQSVELELRANMLEGVSQALKVLTPEQRAKLAAKIRNHKQD